MSLAGFNTMKHDFFLLFGSGFFGPPCTEVSWGVSWKRSQCEGTDGAKDVMIVYIYLLTKATKTITHRKRFRPSNIKDTSLIHALVSTCQIFEKGLYQGREFSGIPLFSNSRGNSLEFSTFNFFLIFGKYNLTIFIINSLKLKFYSLSKICVFTR